MAEHTVARNSELLIKAQSCGANVCSSFSLIVFLSVRRYAVKRLSQTSDENLVLYLLQLVQALKYENFEEIKQGRLKSNQDNK